MRAGSNASSQTRRCRHLMSPFKLLFERNTRTPLDIVFTNVGSNDDVGELCIIIEKRRQVSQKANRALERRHTARAAPIMERHADVTRPLLGC